jgi:hypothetical protein
MKTKIFGGIALVAVAAVMAFNVSLNLNKNNDSSLLALANVEALAIPESGGCDFVREVLTAQSLYVTEITGDGAGSVTVGMKFDNGWSAEIRASIAWGLKDEYTIICYKGGNACCTSMDWKICASSGCPDAGTTGN